MPSRQLLVLQALHGLPDREAMAAVRTDLRWKVACGLPVGHAGFDASTVTCWRRRLLASDRPNRIFDAVRTPTVPDGFELDDFTVNEPAGTVTCPNGIVRPIAPKRSVTFGAACRGCPPRHQLPRGPRPTDP